jgi:hypothetical protein
LSTAQTSTQPGVEQSPAPEGTEEGSAPTTQTTTNDASERPAWLAEILADATTPQGLKKAVARIHEVVDQRDAERNKRIEAERRLAEATGQPATHADDAGRADGLETEPETVAAAQPTQPLNVIEQQLVALDKRQASLQSAIAWAAQNPDGGTLRDKQGNPIEVDSAGLQTYVAQWRADLAPLADQRTALVTRRELAAVEHQRTMATRFRTAETEALAMYPWLKNTSSPEYLQARAFMEANPGISYLPDWPLMVGAHVTAKRSRSTAAVAGSLPPPVAPPLTRARAAAVPPPVVTTASAPGPRVNRAQQQIQEVEARIQERGSMTVEDRRQLSRLRREAATA